VPIRFRKPVRQRLIASQRARGLWGYLKLLRGLTPADLTPEPMAIAEYSTGETMGANCERLAKAFGIDRRAQDAFAMSSHQRAEEATQNGDLETQIVPYWPPSGDHALRRDNGIRGDTTIDKLAALKPAFDRRFGTVTAGNSSYLTDGAAAVLVASERACDRLGLEPMAALRASAVVALDPLEELLLGPAVAVPRALASAALELPEIEVVELHEAFAAQVLAVMKALEDDAWCRRRLGLEAAFGTLDSDRLNAWGGSLSLGHPFGATGARLITTCAHRMARESARFGLIAACAAGAVGMALVLEEV